MAPKCAAPRLAPGSAADSTGTARTNGTRIIAQSAVGAFIAGLPEPRHGRILTSGSVVDSWRHKPLAVRERLRRERITRVRP